ELWENGPPASRQQRVAERAQTLALSGLLCLGRRTVTGLLSTGGLQFQDWSAAYRLFSRGRLDSDQLFAGVRQAVLAELPPTAPLCVALDDSLLPKRGTKIHGVAWRRDPLGPPFQVNLIRAQRVLQFSAALTRSQDAATLRLVPIDFAHAPTPPKPRKNAAKPVWEQYRKDCCQANLCRQAVLRWQALEKSLQPPQGQPPRPLRLLVDGRFTNRQLLKSLSAATTVIGRIRKDAKLYHPAVPAHSGAVASAMANSLPLPSNYGRTTACLGKPSRSLPPALAINAASKLSAHCCGGRPATSARCG
ncbi:MAG TPA: transposase, partial [Aestuariivirgaceae bacterium]|nr:transposase [Aestuariivirgaceae bacterium]